VASDPEELLRSIERTREELALTVDTIAGRLDPKVAAKRGIGKVRSGVTGVVDGARVRFGIGASGSSTGDTDGSPGQPAAAPGAAGDPSAAERGFGDVVVPAIRRVPKPVIGGGLAALLAFAAVLAVRRRRQ